MLLWLNEYYQGKHQRSGTQIDPNRVRDRRRGKRKRDEEK
jgi:hypothetical protein